MYEQVNNIKPTMYLYFIEKFSIKEIAYIQKIEENQVINIIDVSLKRIERIFHVKDTRILSNIIIKFIHFDIECESLNEQQSKRIYQNIMKIAKINKLN